MALGEVVVLHPLETPDRLAGEPPHLGELTGDRKGLGAHAVLDGVSDRGRDGGFEPGRELSELLDLRPCALERGLDVTRLRARLSGCFQPLASPLDGRVVHGATVALAPDGHLGAGVRAPAGADRPAAGGAAGRIAAPRLRAGKRRGAAQGVLRATRRAGAGRARRRQRDAGAPGAAATGATGRGRGGGAAARARRRERALGGAGAAFAQAQAWAAVGPRRATRAARRRSLAAAARGRTGRGGAAPALHQG